MRNRFAALVLSMLIAFVACSTAVEAAAPFPVGTAGYDVSFPQCGGPMPSMPYAFGIIGATGGRAFTHNPCLSAQYAWAALSGHQPSLYMNLKYPSGETANQALTGPMGNCAAADLNCQAYNYGYKTAQDAVAYAQAQNATPASWWLDIETTNTWANDVAQNAVVIRAAIDFLHSQGATIGIYSNPAQWTTIAGSYSPGLPMWITVAPSLAAAPAYCSRGFAGGQVMLVQYLSGNFDANYACTAADLIAPPPTPTPPPRNPNAGPVGTAGSPAIVAADGDCLNVRAQASLTGNINACLASGARVTLQSGLVQADGYRWQQVTAGATTGWVVDAYLRAPTAAEIATVAAIVTPTPAPVATPSGTFAAAPNFGTGKQALAVFTGGSVDQLQTATTGAGASGVWVQDADGKYQLLIVDGPAFLKASIAAAFPRGFSGTTAMTLTK